MTPTLETMDELLAELGGISPDRVMLRPAPGTATEDDVLAYLESPRKRLCELIDGVLVEKATEYAESCFAAYIAWLLNEFVRPKNLGLISGPDGPMRLFPGRVRYPDIGFISWDRLPGRRRPPAPIADIAPDLAVEVLSRSNTRAEMARKRRDYFAGGTRLVWEIDPVTRTVEVFTDPTSSTTLAATDMLTGNPVLPGFTLDLPVLFAELDRQG